MEGSRYVVKSEAKAAQGIMYDATIMPNEKTAVTVATGGVDCSFKPSPPQPVATTMAMTAGMDAHLS